MTVRGVWTIIAFAWIAMIFYLSLLPMSEVPAGSGSDKLDHLAAYAGAMFLLGQRFPQRRLAVFVALCVMGLLIEFLQPRLSNRIFEWFDALANAGGALIGWIVVKTPLGRTLAQLQHRFGLAR